MPPQQNRPRRINVPEVGIDLVLNLVEHGIEEMRDRAGWDTTGSSGLVAGVKGAVTAYLGTHPSILPFLETGLTTTILMFLPNLSPEARQGVRSAIDIATDDIKRAMKAPDDAKAEAILADTSTTFKSNFKKMLDEAEKRRKAKPPYSAIEAKLPPLVRAEWFVWNLSLDARERERLEAVKPLIENVERIVYTMDMPAQLRLEYLEMTLKGKPGLLDTLKDAAMGRETPWTRDIDRRVRAAEETAKQIAKKQGKKAKKLREKNAVTWHDWALRGGIIALVGAAAYVIMRIM